jgi:hypothetical protein
MARLATLPAANPVSGMLVYGKVIYLFGNTSSSSGSNGYLRSIDEHGRARWALALGNGSPSIATAAARDGSGNIWVAGSGTNMSVPNLPSTPTPTPSPTPTLSSSVPDTSTAIILNPDAVRMDPVVPIRKDLTSVLIWKVSSAGILLATYSAVLPAPVLVRAIAVSPTGVSVGGIYPTSTGNAGFILQSDATGKFARPVLIGKSDSVVNSLVRKPDGSLIVIGSSAESIAGKVLIGARDGVIATVSPVGKLVTVLRSSDLKSVRSWQSVTNSLFFGGDSTLNGKTQAVVTKFGSNLRPAWTARYPALGPALTVDISSSSRLMTFSTRVAIQGISGWKPTRPQVLTLIFDSKGALTGAFGAPVMMTPISVGYSRDLGVVVLGSGVLGVSIFHALPR